MSQSHQTMNYSSKMFSELREQNLKVWTHYTQHDFVRGLGDGSLPEKVFLQYLIQDYIFLVHYSRAWSMVVVKAESVSHMRTAAATVHALINEETQLHVEVCKQRGISEQELEAAVEAHENLAYTRYVMDTALSGDILDLLAALAPCVFGYGEIGLNLKESNDTLPQYREWIDMYCGDEYQSVCDAVGELIDEVAAQRLGSDPANHPRWLALSERFAMATQLEVNFWSMGFRLGQAA